MLDVFDVVMVVHKFPCSGRNRVFAAGKGTLDVVDAIGEYRLLMNMNDVTR